jgi:hypothetical protein
VAGTKPTTTIVLRAARLHNTTITFLLVPSMSSGFKYYGRRPDATWQGSSSPTSGTSRIIGASLGLHPLLSDLIATTRTWSKPQKKKEPFTFALFDYLHRGVSTAALHDLQTQLGRTAAIFDWTGLGLHTGSRLSEYGQSKPEKGSPFARVPQGPCKGQALAFMKEDFVYYDASGCLLAQTSLLFDKNRVQPTSISISDTTRVPQITPFENTPELQTRSCAPSLDPYPYYCERTPLVSQAAISHRSFPEQRFRRLSFPHRKRRPAGHHASGLRSSLPRPDTLFAHTHQTPRLAYQSRHRSCRLTSCRPLHRGHRLPAPLESRVCGDLSPRMLPIHRRRYTKGHYRRCRHCSSRSVILK